MHKNVKIFKIVSEDSRNIVSRFKSSSILETQRISFQESMVGVLEREH